MMNNKLNKAVIIAALITLLVFIPSWNSEETTKSLANQTLTQKIFDNHATPNNQECDNAEFPIIDDDCTLKAEEFQCEKKCFLNYSWPAKTIIIIGVTLMFFTSVYAGAATLLAGILLYSPTAKQKMMSFFSSVQPHTSSVSVIGKSSIADYTGIILTAAIIFFVYWYFTTKNVIPKKRGRSDE
jgi:hypothetical protein